MLQKTSASPSTTPQLEIMLRHLVSAAVKTFCKNHNIPNTSIDIVGSRGQTAWLSTNSAKDETRSEKRNSEEITVATKTGITTVTDFKAADEALLGPGAPFFSLTDGILLRHPTKYRACQNIGPIANFRFIPPECDNGVDMDWNYELGTMFINAAIFYYTSGKLENDNNGRWGARGQVNQGVVDRFLNANKYINHLTPNSTGRATLADKEAQALIEECLFLGMSKYDAIATITRITARNIVKQYRTRTSKYLAADRKVDEIFLCGPGAQNPNIVSYLESELADTPIKTLDDKGNSSFREEAVSLAQHALDAILGAYTVVPDTAGVLQPSTVNGKIAPGKRWAELVEHVMRFGGGKPLPVAKRVVVDKKPESKLDTRIEGYSTDR